MFVSESSVLRVLTERGMHLPGLPQVRERRQKRPFPDWAEPIQGQIWIYDFTHFTGLASWSCIAVMDVIPKNWLSTVFSPEETSLQVENAFIAALDADGKSFLLEDAAFAEQLASGHIPDSDDRIPVLLAVSDNGPQMTSTHTAKFMAIARIGQHFGRPGTPNDPSLDRVVLRAPQGRAPLPGHHHRPRRDDPRTRRPPRALQHHPAARGHRLRHPDDEHHGRGQAIRDARKPGLTRARANRIATRRKLRHTTHRETQTDVVNYLRRTSTRNTVVPLVTETASTTSNDARSDKLTGPMKHRG